MWLYQGQSVQDWYAKKETRNTWNRADGSNKQGTRMLKYDEQ